MRSTRKADTVIRSADVILFDALVGADIYELFHRT